MSAMPKDSEQEDEREIILRVQSGETDDFRHIVERHKDRIFAMLMRQTGNRELSEELAQDAFVKAFQNIKRFRFDSSFSTWLTRIALNQMKNYFQSRHYRQSQVKRTLSVELPAQQSSPEEEALSKEHLLIFRDCLSKLKDKHREVLVLKGLEGKDYEQIAGFVGTPVGTVRSRLNTARTLIKDCMKKRAA